MVFSRSSFAAKDPLSGSTGIRITVDGNRGGLIERLVNNMSLIIQKRKTHLVNQSELFAQQI